MFKFLALLTLCFSLNSFADGTSPDVLKSVISEANKAKIPVKSITFVNYKKVSGQKYMILNVELVGGKSFPIQVMTQLAGEGFNEVTEVKNIFQKLCQGALVHSITPVDGPAPLMVLAELQKAIKQRLAHIRSIEKQNVPGTYLKEIYGLHETQLKEQLGRLKEIKVGEVGFTLSTLKVEVAPDHTWTKESLVELSGKIEQALKIYDIEAQRRFKAYGTEPLEAQVAAFERDVPKLPPGLSYRETLAAASKLIKDMYKLNMQLLSFDRNSHEMRLAAKHVEMLTAVQTATAALTVKLKMVKDGQNILKTTWDIPRILQTIVELGTQVRATSETGLKLPGMAQVLAVESALVMMSAESSALLEQSKDPKVLGEFEQRLRNLELNLFEMKRGLEGDIEALKAKEALRGTAVAEGPTVEMKGLDLELKVVREQIKIVTELGVKVSARK